MNIVIDDINKKVAEKLNLDINIVNEINRSQFKLLMETIQNKSFKDVKLIYIGKFIVKQKYAELYR